MHPSSRFQCICLKVTQLLGFLQCIFFRSTSWLSCHKQHNWDASFQWTSWQRWMARLLAKTGAFCRDSRLQSWFAQRGISWPLDLPGILFWSIALRVPQRPLLQSRLWCLHACVFLFFPLLNQVFKCLVCLLFFLHLLTNQGQTWKMEDGSAVEVLASAWCKCTRKCLVSTIETSDGESHQAIRMGSSYPRKFDRLPEQGRHTWQGCTLILIYHVIRSVQQDLAMQHSTQSTSRHHEYE